MSDILEQVLEQVRGLADDALRGKYKKKPKDDDAKKDPQEGDLTPEELAELASLADKG